MDKLLNGSTITTTKAIDILKLNRSIFLSFVRKGFIKGIKIEGKWLIEVESLMKWKEFKDSGYARREVLSEEVRKNMYNHYLDLGLLETAELYKDENNDIVKMK